MRSVNKRARFPMHGYGPYSGPSTIVLIIITVIVVAVLCFAPRVDPILRKVLIAIPVVLFFVWLLIILLSVANHIG